MLTTTCHIESFKKDVHDPLIRLDVQFLDQSQHDSYSTVVHLVQERMGGEMCAKVDAGAGH